MILNPKLLIVDDERGIVDMIQSYFQAQYDILDVYKRQVIDVEEVETLIC